MINWPGIMMSLILTGGGVLTGGVGVALVNNLFRKPQERELTKKERALAEQVETDRNIKLIEIWMVSNQKLLESNNRLEKSNEKLQRYGEKMQKDMQRQLSEVRQEMNEAKQAINALVAAVDRVVPRILRETDDDGEIQELDAALRWARSINNQ